MLTAEQKELRKHGIGSSEVAAVCGLNPFQTPTDVWMVKTERKPEFEGNEATEIGSALESWIAEKYYQKASKQIVQNDITRQHDQHKYCMATPDYFCSYGEMILEIKNVGPNAIRYWDDSKADGIPVYVIAQIQWQMFVCDIPKAVACALLGGVKIRWWEFDFDEDMAGKMFKIAERFWFDNVLADKPPDETNPEYVKLLHPKDNGQMLDATETTISLAKDRVIADTNWKAAKIERDKIDNQLKAVIGPASGIEGVCTYRADKNGKRTFRFTYGGKNE
jgi:putative phage-type endonuclease